MRLLKIGMTTILFLATAIATYLTFLIGDEFGPKVVYLILSLLLFLAITNIFYACFSISGRRREVMICDTCKHLQRYITARKIYCLARRGVTHPRAKQCNKCDLREGKP